MLYCEKCNVKIRTEHEHCPLCSGVLVGETDENAVVFPETDNKNGGVSFFSIITFISIIISVVVYIINDIFTPEKDWNLYVLGAVLSCWIVLSFGIYKKRNLLKNLTWQVIILSFLMFSWDKSMGFNKWSINYGIPILIILTLIFMFIIISIKKLPKVEYTIYIIIDCIFGIVVFILQKINIITSIAPALICGGISIIVISGMIIFNSKHFIEELKKNFNI